MKREKKALKPKEGQKWKQLWHVEKWNISRFMQRVFLINSFQKIGLFIFKLISPFQKTTGAVTHKEQVLLKNKCPNKIC